MPTNGPLPPAADLEPDATRVGKAPNCRLARADVTQLARRRLARGNPHPREAVHRSQPCRPVEWLPDVAEGRQRILTLRLEGRLTGRLDHSHIAERERVSDGVLETAEVRVDF